MVTDETTRCSGVKESCPNDVCAAEELPTADPCPTYWNLHAKNYQ